MRQSTTVPWFFDTNFAILAGRFNQPGTFSQGDFNYDGVANIADFSILASKFNTTLPAPLDLPRRLMSAAGGHKLQPPIALFAMRILDEVADLPSNSLCILRFPRKSTILSIE